MAMNKQERDTYFNEVLNPAFKFSDLREKVDALFDSVSDDALYEKLCQYTAQRIQDTSLTVKCVRREVA